MAAGSDLDQPFTGAHPTASSITAPEYYGFLDHRLTPTSFRHQPDSLAGKRPNL
jgi:hypothetical protein